MASCLPLDFIQGHLPVTALQDKTTTELLHCSGMVINNSSNTMTTTIISVSIKPGQDRSKSTAKRQATLDINTSIGGQGVITEEMRVIIEMPRVTTWLRSGGKL